MTGLRTRGEGDTTPNPTFTCRALRECESVVVRVSQHGVRLHRVSHFTLTYVFTHVPSRRKMRDKSWINSRKLKEKVIPGLAFEKNWRKIGANVTLQKIIRENRDNFDLIRRNAEDKSLSGGVCVPRGGVRSRPAVAPPPRYCAKQNQPRPSARRGPAGLPALPATMCIRTK